MKSATPAHNSFLPDFCGPANLLRTMLIAQLLAIILATARPGSLIERTQALALITLFIQWVAVVDVALLCVLRRWLTRLDDRLAATAAFVLLQAVTLAFTLLAHGLATVTGLAIVTGSLAGMVVEHGIISVIVSAVALRYFYVTAQWQRNMEAEAQARVQALQARIRPHFLFNSMNTIASLTRSDPVAAERAVEDLAELFRATLSERSMVPLEEELAFVASYLRIEHERLGERLAVDWRIDPAAGSAVLPALSLQPLVENAVYHGIEARPGGGTIHIATAAGGDRIRLLIRNPVPVGGSSAGGHRVAQDNVRQRLALAFGDDARFETTLEDGVYAVRIEVPTGVTGQGAETGR